MKHHTCPVWIGYFLASRLRRLVQDPFEILSPYVEPGMTVLDAGSAMGFFSLPLAELVGPNGRVVCVDLQDRMLARLSERARRRGLSDRIETRPCTAESLGVQDYERRIDFALAFAVIHETSNPARFIADLAGALRPGGKALLAEPKGHVTAAEFDATTSSAIQAGLRVIDSPSICGVRTVLLEKP